MSVNSEKMTEKEFAEFTEIHKSFIPKRKKRFSTYDIYHNSKKKYINKTKPIIERAIHCLTSNGIENFDEKKLCIYFHKRNCGFEKKKYKWSAWNKDDHAVIYPKEESLKSSGNIQIIHGYLASDGAVAKISGKEG